MDRKVANSQFDAKCNMTVSDLGLGARTLGGQSHSVACLAALRCTRKVYRGGDGGPLRATGDLGLSSTSCSQGPFHFMRTLFHSSKCESWGRMHPSWSPVLDA